MANPANDPQDGDFLDRYVTHKRFSGSFWLRVAAVLIFAAMVWLFKTSVLDDSIGAAELKDSLTLFNISSQWTVKEFNDDPDFKGITLVPEVSFRIRNSGPRELRFVYLLGVFRFLPTGKFIGEGYQMTLKEPLPPGAESATIQLRCGYGYRASSTQAFEANRRHWMNAYVELFAKSRNSRTVPLKTFYISRKIAGADIDVRVK
jgi:hypothetical protein